MDSIISSFAWLLPAWIIGIPLLAAIVSLARTPKADHLSTNFAARQHAGLPGAIGGRNTPAVSS